MRRKNHILEVGRDCTATTNGYICICNFNSYTITCIHKHLFVCASGDFRTCGWYRTSTMLKPQTLEQQRFYFPCQPEVHMEHDLRTFSGLMTQSNALMETENMNLIVNPHAQA